MNSVIPVAVPIEFRQVLADQRGEAGLPRWALEALVVEAVREGLITSGFAGQVLGLTFEERERFLSEHAVVHNDSDAELEEQQRAIDRAILR